MNDMDELLDEAIAKAKEAGDSQLVEWLRMARGGKSAARWYTAKLRDLEAENAKLRKLLRDMWHFGFSENSGANSAAEWNIEADALFDRMRELGVEAR